MTKLAEGGYNKVFRLAMDNGSIVIARIPNPTVVPYFKTTASEVATMEFVRSILDIPVPRVLSWSGTADNSIQSEYIMMEEAPGTRLTDVWNDMEVNSKAGIVGGIVDIEKKLSSISFSRYGSLYFADDAFPGCEKAEAVGHDVPESKKKAIASRFVIGPVASEEFWEEERAT